MNRDARTWLSILAALSCVGVLASGCSCGTAIETDASIADADFRDGWADGGALDGGLDSAVFDAADSGVCTPVEGHCATDDDCVAWGAAVAPSGTHVVTMCAVPVCTLGVTACHPTTFGTECECATGVLCTAGQICVSDTPGGPPRCAEQCAGR